MPLYHVNIQLGNQRAVIAVDHVLMEYGISEQEFVSTWFMDRPEIQGDGDTFEEAIEQLFISLERHDHEAAINTLHCNPLIREMRHQYAKMMKTSKTKFRAPIIGDVG